MLRRLIFDRSDPAAIALLAPGRSPLTFGGLAEQVSRTGRTLSSLGIRRGDRVALVCSNGLGMASAFLGIAAHCACAPLNPAYREPEFDFYLADLRPAAVVVETGLDSAVRAAAVARGVPLIELDPDLGFPAGATVAEVEAEAAPDAVALLLHTSGTTSRPKLVPLTQANLCASARNIAASLGLAASDRCLNVMPLFHIHGLGAAVLASLASGASVVCAPGFVGPRFFEWVKEFAPTWYTAVPTIHQAAAARAAADPGIAIGHGLRFIRSCSSALPPSLMEEMESIFGVPVIEAYGMTEAAHQMASNPLPPARRKAGSVGIAAGPEVAIMDEDGKLLSPGATGEAVIRGENITPGYADNPEANQRSFTNGWFRTGDQGYLDDEGYLFLTGRLKEIINRGGEKIAPREIDEALLAHPAVGQAVAFAAAHRTLGEAVAAAVVLRPGASTTARELREFTAQRLTSFKVPEQILFLDEIPKGATGKIQRIGLAAKLGVTEGATERAEYVEPQTETERQLAALFGETLGVERVGRHDSFFDRGGDSLLTVTLLAAIRETLGVEIAVIDFVEDPTVAGVAQRVDSNRAGSAGTASGRLRVVIRPGQARTPLFCIPGSQGDLLGFIRLARRLERQQPVIAFRLPPVDRIATYRVEDLAAEYVEELLESQSEGPYHLAGECVGGLVAFEMAQQLHAGGREVGMLALLDCFNQAWGGDLPLTERLGYRFELLGRRFAHNRRSLAEAGLEGALGYVRPRLSATLRVTRERAEEGAHRLLMRAGGLLPEGLRNQRLAIRHAAAQYRPSRWPGRLVLLRVAEPRVEGYSYPQMGWQGLAAEVVIHDIPGSHTEMLGEAGSGAVAEALMLYLAAASREPVHG